MSCSSMFCMIVFGLIIYGVISSLRKKPAVSLNKGDFQMQSRGQNLPARTEVSSPANYPCVPYQGRAPLQQVIRFPCPACNRQLTIKAPLRERQSKCPACSTPLLIPAMAPVPVVIPREHIPFVLPADYPEATVPVNLGMPRGMGSLQTKVTQKTADHMASTWLGGVLVVIGVVIAAMFGIKVSGKGGGA